jgi:hypothetical protein
MIEQLELEEMYQTQEQIEQLNRKVKNQFRIYIYKPVQQAKKATPF